MAKRARRLGVRLRPHVKTHKCVEIARLQAPDGAITVSTLAEARFFADAGFRDVTYAFPFPPGKEEEALDIASRLESLNLLVDHPDAARRLDHSARGAGTRFPVFLKVDCGYGRAGVDPESEEAVALARLVAESQGLELRGVLTHAGHAYHARSREEILAVARRERDVVVGLAERLRADGLDVPEVSLGSTPTCSVVDRLDGVTEIRPGNYAFLDVFQSAVGSGDRRDVALSVLATVAGRYPERGEVLIDAGSLALSRDPGPTHVDPACGLGVVLPVDGDGEGRVTSLSQEHGIVRGLPDLPVGEKVRVLPNHSCLTAAAHDRYHVVEGGEVQDVWRPVRGW
jgi:D-serine deaminase-like pyridoxal phosphate-dependent protein